MSGYERSPDYGGKPVTRWTVPTAVAVLLIASAALLLLRWMQLG